MAGGFLHCVGKGLVPHEDVAALLDDMGDAREAIEEMLFMIDFLAGGCAQKKKEAHDAWWKSRNPSFKPESFEDFMNNLEDLPSADE